MKLAWLTDVHLNLVRSDTLSSLLNSVRASAVDAIVISGDIGESQSVCTYLTELDVELDVPIYFVLGNHDFYGGSIREVRKSVQQLVSSRRWLVYLTNCGVVELTKSTALVGHDGWADARFGNFEHSEVILTDYVSIDELKPPELCAEQIIRPKPELKILLQRLAEEGAAHFKTCLDEALKTYEHVVAVTHVPPFREACWYGGRLSDDNYLPHFSSRVIGDVMLSAMIRYPKKHLTVLCGHTHGSGKTNILPNLEVLTGGAEYGCPVISRVLEIP
jgi:Icc-related predicted phosphoesterase